MMVSAFKNNRVPINLAAEKKIRKNNVILGNYGKLPNYESCLVLDVTPNFFIGRTIPVSGIRFDPKFKRTGHTQAGFQIDACV